MEDCLRHYRAGVKWHEERGVIINEGEMRELIAVKRTNYTQTNKFIRFQKTMKYFRIKHQLCMLRIGIHPKNPGFQTPVRIWGDPFSKENVP